jgi:hypothetical protein
MVVSFLLVLVGVLVAVAFAIGAIARGWVLQMDELVLHGIDVPRTRDLVAIHVENVHDTRFGFPTGIFRVEEGRSTSTRLVAREINFGGGTGFRIVRYGIMIPLEFTAAVARESCLGGMFAFFAGCFVVGIVIVPIFCVAVVEFVLRWLMRSEIVAELEQVAGDHDASRVRFTLRGLSAFGVRRQLRDGLAPPVLPVAYGGSAIENAPEAWSDDRLNVVYASGIGIAVVIAAIVVAVSPGLRGAGGTSAASYGYSGSSYSDSSSYDSSGDDSYDDSSGSSSYDSSSGDTSDGAASDDGSSSDGSSSDGAGGTAGEDDSSAGSAGSADLTVNAARGGTFAIHPPSGWSRESSGEQHDGFVESLWRSPDDTDAYFLVDYTPGFAASARAGAQGVRGLYLNGRVSDYDEWDFSATTIGGYDAQRWEYEHRGLHKVDTFVSACGTGYAILGAAPAGHWDDYADLYASATDTFEPTCGSSPDDSVSEGDSSDDASNGGDTSSDSSPSDDQSSASSDHVLSPEAVLRAHYDHLNAGEYSAAFALMSPRYRSSFPRWVANRATADPGLTVIDLGPTRIAGANAFVDVSFYARDRVNVKGSDTKCRYFEGTAHLRRYDAVWRYDPTGDGYAKRVVHRSNPNCP